MKRALGWWFFFEPGFYQRSGGVRRADWTARRHSTAAHHCALHCAYDRHRHSGRLPGGGGRPEPRWQDRPHRLRQRRRFARMYENPSWTPHVIVPAGRMETRIHPAGKQRGRSRIATVRLVWRWTCLRKAAWSPMSKGRGEAVTLCASIREDRTPSSGMNTGAGKCVYPRRRHQGRLTVFRRA